MTVPVQKVGCQVLLFILLAACVEFTSSQAQQKEEKKKDVPAAQAQQKQEKKMAAPVKAVIEKKAAPRRAVVVRNNRWTNENLDQWVFQQDRNASEARKRLDSRLTLQIESIDRACQLTDAQTKKLQLAGRGDIKRFFDRYEMVKQKFQLIKDDEQKAQNIWQDISPLQMTLQAGLFDNDSLLYKSLRNTLTLEQFSPYDAVARERRTFRHRATIELVVTSLEQATPLRDTQRRELIAVLMNQIKPPRKSGLYDYHVIMCQLSRLPEEKLKPLFDEMQWRIVNRQLTQFKGWDQWLKQSGSWPVEDDDEADRADAQPVPPKK